MKVDSLCGHVDSAVVIAPTRGEDTNDNVPRPPPDTIVHTLPVITFE